MAEERMKLTFKGRKGDKKGRKYKYWNPDRRKDLTIRPGDVVGLPTKTAKWLLKHEPKMWSKTKTPKPKKGGEK
jgi:hypothetical protein